ncbi:2-amino-4-hydroxy-6-hydroxymethyldihydropteridine diphosphokinase [Rhodospirillum rubrum]|uniref:2-amino-4-hydroxy-6-hydroxymethyldihydropteridine pyrophosphokinase n=1 Tax=Rhodospirillum rubrum (strain ATCC 11170 / ATH 1.1.1 / DSM 467 / LMG 4362 / NCIMB 8255 / S1) TaxID=269796 RepID=Q2RT87_RHORT|nr:2-amino-4-hydroxy-6-hydroxymethyldihydropteridine diphosphokinase [Rhodospirillum rubrum]ABC22658.1 7,8-Dihydro-6-hydroxymethylpterin-pyrophosphokinase, HPPK [Rhodospirillum rubrum ATCC 11170]AEO48376.1 7,8-dihydro-6-hydroxymethylpterin-pyrophosphokinase [Rhodospirillum rubrum F11]MBK5954255.1 2-amino-4-hydroxy-6-hydroxymethyldihydropteridine diphosphokinase [Rhodospirillum rubrum]QXG82279.1 2-amino-4-hydroxy-6-hydroxymethyldihydropteridine diphosphokinase [Rhodospirillum rubrum]HAQ01422.1 
MIYIALGANLAGPAGSPRDTLDAALVALEDAGVVVAARSAWYRTSPVPPSDQPDYVNGVARLVTDLDPVALLGLLHRLEDQFGRRRGEINAARTLDLDLLDYDELRRTGAPPLLPHPRMAERGFVLFPLREIAPDWRHPVLDQPIDTLIAALAADQAAERL